ncbi:MAG: hypothetical protein ACREQ9_03820, partial [Candidatus Binatia bacterium]
MTRRNDVMRRLVLLSLAVPCAALAETIGTLDPGEVLRWQGGRFTNAIVPRPELCGDLALDDLSTGARCDTRVVTVNAPPGFWDDHPGGLEVSIRWEDEAEDVDLWVFGPDQRPAASSTGFGSRSESALVRAPANGDYRIVVVPASTSDTSYEGLAELEITFPTKEGDLLPNLVALPPEDFHFAVGAYTLTPFDSEGAAGVSCYPEEIADGARKCLRFDAGAANEGAGRFEIQIDLGTLAGERTVEQAIVRSDGGRRFCAAGSYSVHPFHGHVHYRAFTRYDIYRAGGGAGVRSSKAGFCLIDGDHRRFDAQTQGNEPRTGAFPDCNLPSETGADGKAAMVQGISRGWAD